MCESPSAKAGIGSFMQTLKVEAVTITDYETFEDAAANIPRFIGEVCNERRLHSAIGYLSPKQYEERNTRPLTKTATRTCPVTGAHSRYRQFWHRVLNLVSCRCPHQRLR